MNKLEFLKSFADSQDEFDNHGSDVFFSRHGKEYELNLSTKAGIGYVVDTCNGEMVGKTINEFIIIHLLELPTLATQIVKSIENKNKGNNSKYIQSPATFSQKHVVNGKDELLQRISEPEPFSTHIFRLTAEAGQGKTYLLDEIAKNLAKGFRVSDSPAPLLLPIDLLGRYVGSIDDAIAGSLNNTYNFPKLNQRDIVNCISNNWICLALDGFDELVARVGARDALTKISDLLDQINNSGSIILSARDTFFESSNIVTAIQSYLKPRKGSYSTAEVKLCGWTKENGVELLSSLNMNNPENAYNDILQLVDGDQKLLSSPFFLTKISKLWQQGVGDIAKLKENLDHLSRIHFVLDKYISREAEEKWVDSKGNKLLTHNQHNVVLGAVAEEMWSASSFSLSLDDLRITCEIGLENENIDAEKVMSSVDRIHTHAVFHTTSNNFYGFSHDQFLNYYLGMHLANRIVHNEINDLARILSDRELSPPIVSWVEWQVKKIGVSDIGEKISDLSNLAKVDSTLFLKNNIGTLLGVLLSRGHENFSCAISNCIFPEDSLNNKHVTNIKFIECHFLKSDFSFSKFERCTFNECTFTDPCINDETSFSNSIFEMNNTFTSLVLSDDTLYEPYAINKNIESMGGCFENEDIVENAYSISVSRDAIRSINKFISKSNKFFYVSVEEVKEETGNSAYEIAELGIKCGIFKVGDKFSSTKNNKGMSITVDCDKNDLLSAQYKKPIDENIERFWEEVSDKFPGRRNNIA